MKCKGGQMGLSRSLSQCQSYISTPLSKLSVNDDDVADEDHNDDDNDDDDDDHDIDDIEFLEQQSTTYLIVKLVMDSE